MTGSLKIISAGAGAGKTTSLSKEILTCLYKSSDKPEKIASKALGLDKQRLLIFMYKHDDGNIQLWPYLSSTLGADKADGTVPCHWCPAKATVTSLFIPIKELPSLSCSLVFILGEQGIGTP